MPILNSTLKRQTRPRPVQKTNAEELERLYAHVVALDNAIRALETYQRFGPSRAVGSLNLFEKCS